MRNGVSCTSLQGRAKRPLSTRRVLSMACSSAQTFPFAIRRLPMIRPSSNSVRCCDAHCSCFVFSSFCLYSFCMLTSLSPSFSFFLFSLSLTLPSYRNRYSQGYAARSDDGFRFRRTRACGAAYLDRVHPRWNQRYISSIKEHAVSLSIRVQG